MREDHFAGSERHALREFEVSGVLGGFHAEDGRMTSVAGEAPTRPI
jgi:hypothetical protein